MNLSPIRYPGGKGKLAAKIAGIIDASTVRNGVYIEPFAGGAGAALSLLFSGKVQTIVINDVDKAVASFWKSILNETERFVQKIHATAVTIDEWRNQKAVYQNQVDRCSFELGFAFFFLNRTNRSGILTGGPIGGFEQKGDWKLDCRFNKDRLIEQIVEIAKRKKQIRVYNQDIFDFIERYLPRYQDNGFIYFDPPYFNKAGRLYKNSFNEEQHRKLHDAIVCLNAPWIVSYDNVPNICRIYSDVASEPLSINYCAAKKGTGSEIMFYCPELARLYLKTRKQSPS
ncbi:MAG: DNA adenine methylase [Thermoguttaceae bacterium]|nr:DNA adenine methylase [Thermoguttaceae bacterium]